MASGSETVLLRGIGKIINPDTSKKGVNADELASKVISTYKSAGSPSIVTSRYQKELSEFGKILGVEFDQPSVPSQRQPNYGQQFPSNDDESDSDIESDIEENDEQSREQFRQPMAYSAPAFAVPTQTYSAPTNTYSAPTQSYSSPRYESEAPANRFIPSFQSDSGPSPYNSWIPGNSSRGNGGELQARTEEQLRHDDINRVIKNMGGESTNVWSIANEKKEDAKAVMLEEIDSLLISLEEDGIDVSRIPRPKPDSSYEDVEAIRRILRYKNNRVRSSSLADEIIMWAVDTVEDYFDGSRTILGWRPYLKGWHTQVQVKLRRMRHNTSSLVSKILSDNNVGEGAQIAMELIPSAFVYSKKQKLREQAGMNKSKYSNESLSESINSIRNIT